MTTSADTREKVQPVALAHICSTDTYPDIKLEVLDGSLLQPEHSPVPLYAALQPDAGLVETLRPVHLEYERLTKGMTFPQPDETVMRPTLTLGEMAAASEAFQALKGEA